jgi:hypothetical protein
MATVTAMGVSVDLPPGWDGRIFRRPTPPPPDPASGRRATAASTAHYQATSHSVTHAANFALPAGTGDFGSSAVELMGPEHVLVVLFEYHPHSSTTPLFEAGGPPTSLSPDSFSPSALQRPLPVQAGTQVFFSTAGRAFSLYVVLGSFERRHHLVPAVNALLRSIDIGPL